MEERKNSTHCVEVIRVCLQPHPNADRLSVVQAFGYQVVTATESWLAVAPENGEREGPVGERAHVPHWLGAYIPPDSLVPIARPEFSFLAERSRDGYHHVKAKKLRGVVSFGLLVPAPPGSKPGDDVAELLGVKHYNPPSQEEKQAAQGWSAGAEDDHAPNVRQAKYDLDALRRYKDAFNAGERVVITEKLDGSNARYVYQDGRMHCGSRTQWKKEYADYSHITVEYLTQRGCDKEKAEGVVARLQAQPRKRNLWWEALRRTPSLQAFCEANPGVLVYGEVFGRQGRLKYTADPDGVFFAAFDIFREGQFMGPLEARAFALNVPWAPIIVPSAAVVRTWAEVPVATVTHLFDFDKVCELAEGPSLVPGAACIREGVVVSPLVEREHPQCGRVKLKAVSATYLEKHG